MFFILLSNALTQEKIMISSKTCSQVFIDFYITCLKQEIPVELWNVLDNWMLINFNLNFEQVLRADVVILKRIVSTRLAFPVNFQIDFLKKVYDKFSKKDSGVGAGPIKARAYELVKSVGKKITCPYCNLSTIENNELNGLRCSELDHFFSKSVYPYISLSILNLVPICETCNGNKGAYVFHAHPYDVDDISKLSKFFLRKVNNDFVVGHHVSGEMFSNDNRLRSLGRYCNFDDEVKWILKTTRDNKKEKVLEMIARRSSVYPDIYKFIDLHFKIRSKREEHYLMAQSKFTTDIIRAYYEIV